MPRWSSFEPIADGRGVRFRSDDGLTFDAPAGPMADQYAQGLPQYALGGPKMGAALGDDTRQPGPPAAVADVPPADYSQAPSAEPLVSMQPAPPAPAATPQAPAPPRLPPPAPLLPGGRPRESMMPQPIPTDRIEPGPLPGSETEWDATARAIAGQMAAGDAVRRTPAAWLPSTRTREAREAPLGAIGDVLQAQQDLERIGSEKTRAMARAEDEARQLEGKKAGIEGTNTEKQRAALTRFQEAATKRDAEIEEERRRLKNPGDYWEDRSTRSDVLMSLGLALSAVGGAVAGQESQASRVLDDAMKAHLERRQKNIDLLLGARGRSREDYIQEAAMLEAEGVNALKQVQYQIADTLARGKNPIIRQALMQQAMRPPGAPPLAPPERPEEFGAWIRGVAAEGNPFAAQPAPGSPAAPAPPADSPASSLPPPAPPVAAAPAAAPRARQDVSRNPDVQALAAEERRTLEVLRGPDRRRPITEEERRTVRALEDEERRTKAALKGAR